MVCIYCGGKTQVSNSRTQKRSNSVWRRRTCTQCLATVSSNEKIDYETAIIITGEKSSQPFSRDILFISVYDSCRHRKTAIKDSIGLTDTIIKQLIPQIKHASLSKAQIKETTGKILARFDSAAGVQYKAYHP